MFQIDLLQGRRILVSGADGAAGEAVGRRLLAAGAELVLAGRDEDLLDDLAWRFAESFAAPVSTLARAAEEAVPPELLDAAWPADGMVDCAGDDGLLAACAARWIAEGRPAAAVRLGAAALPGADGHGLVRINAIAAADPATPAATALAVFLLAPETAGIDGQRIAVAAP